MKNSIKTFAVALAFIAASFTSNAEDKETKKSAGFGTGIYATKSGKIKVYVDKSNADASTTLLLRNENGQVVYRETFGRNELKFGRTLDVDALSTGKYEIEIASKGEKQSKSFEVSEQRTERVLAIK
jgi:hypothetical protein